MIIVKSQRAYSTKTRIKTFATKFTNHKPYTQRAYFTKTRIKTLVGLNSVKALRTQRAYSTKTRIKTSEKSLLSSYKHSESIFH